MNNRENFVKLLLKVLPFAYFCTVKFLKSIMININEKTLQDLQFPTVLETMVPLSRSSSRKASSESQTSVKGYIDDSSRDGG